MHWSISRPLANTTNGDRGYIRTHAERGNCIYRRKIEIVMEMDDEILTGESFDQSADVIAYRRWCEDPDSVRERLPGRARIVSCMTEFNYVVNIRAAAVLCISSFDIFNFIEESLTRVGMVVGSLRSPLVISCSLCVQI